MLRVPDDPRVLPLRALFARLPTLIFWLSNLPSPGVTEEPRLRRLIRGGWQRWALPRMLNHGLDFGTGW